MSQRAQPVIRRLLTRLLGLIPSMVVAIAVGRSGINTLLVASQVALAIVLPFVTFPLIWLTSSKTVMSVRKPQSSSGSASLPPIERAPRSETTDSERAVELIDYSSGKIATGIGLAIWLVMVAANVYVIVALAMGQRG